MQMPSPASDQWKCPRCGRSWPRRCEGHRWFIPDGSGSIVEGCERCVQFEVVQPELLRNAAAACGLDQGRLAEMTLERFAPMTENECKALIAAERLVERWTNGVVRSMWFWSELRDPPEKRRFGDRDLIVSGCGCGKTHLASGLARAAQKLRRTVRIMTEKAALDKVRATYGGSEGPSELEVVAELAEPWLLVLDDVGAANVRSLDWFQSISYAIVDARYLAGKPILMTTNLTPGQLAERLGPRTMSRLDEMGVGVHLDGPDRRRMA